MGLFTKDSEQIGEDRVFLSGNRARNRAVDLHLSPHVSLDTFYRLTFRRVAAKPINSIINQN